MFNIKEISFSTEKKVYGSNIKSIVVIWTNNSLYNIIFGDMFGIQRLQDGVWVKCLLSNKVAVNTIVVCSAKSLHKHSYDISKYSNLLTEGTYRFLARFSVLGHQSDTQSYLVISKFQIRDI